MAFKKIIFLTLILPFVTRAQTTTSSDSIPTPQKSPLTLTASLELPTHTFLISTDAGRVDDRLVTQRIQYNPTFGPNIGVHADYEQWSFGLTKRFYFSSPSDEKKYGKTNYDDYRLAYKFSRYLMLTTYLQNYRGFSQISTVKRGLKHLLETLLVEAHRAPTEKATLSTAPTS